MDKETLIMHPGRYWHKLADGRIQCDLCPRDCRLQEGQRGACFVRMREGDTMVLTTYGRSSGFCIDPIEKKPLNHFSPGVGTASPATGIPAGAQTQGWFTCGFLGRRNGSVLVYGGKME